MSLTASTRTRLALGAIAIAVFAGAAGYGLGHLGKAPPASAAAPQPGRKVLYWYDPMYPAQHFERSGKSPYMDMELQPKYADEALAATGMSVDPSKVQALGVRLATVERGVLSSSLSAPAVIDFNERDVAVVQARAAGFVQRVYGRAPGDVIAAGAPLADVIIPEWAGAQTEYLAVRRSGEPALIQASRERLRLLGMAPPLVDALERTGRVRNVVTISAPAGGVIKTLGVRAGMAMAAGETLAEVNGLSSVWLNGAIPEAAAAEVRVGGAATATLAAYPGEVFTGRVAAILPQAQADTHTVTARIELPNPHGKLRPGMYASVQFGGAPSPALLVPSEAVIRTGKRTLVMLAQAGGRYRPAEIQAGRESGGRTEVLAGLAEGERVVASGQFLLDSEANLSGIAARPIGGVQPAPPPALYESKGRVETISPTSVTISHEPVPAAGWPAMTMTFHLADPRLAVGIKVGDRVAFGFDQPAAGPTVRQMTKAAP